MEVAAAFVDAAEAFLSPFFLRPGATGGEVVDSDFFFFLKLKNGFEPRFRKGDFSVEEVGEEALTESGVVAAAGDDATAVGDDGSDSIMASYLMVVVDISASPSALEMEAAPPIPALEASTTESGRLPVSPTPFSPRLEMPPPTSSSSSTSSESRGEGDEAAAATLGKRADLAEETPPGPSKGSKEYRAVKED